jgi:hypothetical protein
MMAQGTGGKRRRAGVGWVVQALEGRVLLSGAGTSGATSAPAPVDAVPGERATMTSLQSSSNTTLARPSVGLVATVKTVGTNRVVNSGLVRFTLVAPTPEVLGVGHLNPRGQARLTTRKLGGGGTFEVEAQYVPPSRLFATSTERIKVEVAPPLVTSFLVHAPRYYGAPGTPVTFSVTALDRAGQPVPSYAGTIDIFSPTDHSAKLPARTYTFTTADQGTHEFPDGITFHKGGAEVIKVDQVNNTRIVGKGTFGIE